MKVTVVRILRYTGAVDWVNDTLDRSLLNPATPVFQAATGTIEEIYRGSAQVLPPPDLDRNPKFGGVK